MNTQLQLGLMIKVHPIFRPIMTGEMGPEGLEMR